MPGSLWTAINLLAALSLSAAVNAAPLDTRNNAGPVKDIVVFGDSYSDNCQLWRLNASPADQAAFPFPNCPPAPTGRASGGYAWPEILNNGTDAKVHIYATSAATCSNEYFNRTTKAYDGSTIEVTSVQQQIAQFSSYEGSKISYDTAIAVVFIGTNDCTFFTSPLQYPPSSGLGDVLDPGRTWPDEAKCIIKRVNELTAVGFTRIVLFNQIPLEYTPYFSNNDFSGYAGPIIQNGTAVSILAKTLVDTNNALQAATVPYQIEQAGKVDLCYYDTHTLFQNLIDNPSQYYGAGATPTDWCNKCVGIQGGPDCTLCDNPDSFIWFDPLHPSQKSDEILAMRFAESLGLDFSWTAPQ